MRAVKVIEFVRPNGKQVEHNVAIPDVLLTQLACIEIAGLRFTLEKIEEGVSSVCLEDPRYGDFNAQIVGTERWMEAVYKMVGDFSSDLLREWRDQMGKP